MTDGFLGRWSRRKLEAREDKPPEAGLPQPSVTAADGATVEPVAPTIPQGPVAHVPAEPPAEVPPPPTLEDAQALTPESDFNRFAARDVAPQVKNAAMKKLFADPRYNVMDGLDVYIDDYSRPNPIPQPLLRKLAGAKLLGLFDQEEREEEEAARQARDVADNLETQSVAHSDPAPAAVPDPLLHAHPDLRLQQDHAAEGDDPGRGAG